MSVQRLPTPTELIAEAVRCREALDHLQQLTVDDLRRLYTFYDAFTDAWLGADIKAAFVKSYESHQARLPGGVPRGPEGGPSEAFISGEVAGLTRTVELVYRARGALGHGR